MHAIISLILFLICFALIASADQTPDQQAEDALTHGKCVRVDPGSGPKSCCFGYESDCSEEDRYLRTECPDASQGWTETKQQQEQHFFDQADFGYVTGIRNELTSFCEPRSDSRDVSRLTCSRFTKFCSGSNLFIDFRQLDQVPEPMRYRDDVLHSGLIGGWDCELRQKQLLAQGAHKSPLQSWFAEIEHFVVRNKADITCDVTIEKPVFLMKLDATGNLYHHFCDFLNLYLSLHVNGSFNYDNQIIIWDTMRYNSNFGVTWKAFTDNPVLNLTPFKGKRVCFTDIVFPLLPRMVFGMYYNMPLIPGCCGSGLFHAFNRHLLHRLHVKRQPLPHDSKKIKITVIDRQTRHRNILNIDVLITALRNKNKNFEVRKVSFSHQMPFLDQLAVTANTDILIGMHGAGLTHCLFLPNHAVLFELYNCDDEHCYKDLSRLRGVKYLTWQKEELVFAQDEGQHPQLGAHKKFTSYSFDVKEFLRLVAIAVKHVRTQRLRPKNNIRNQNRDEL